MRIKPAIFIPTLYFAEGLPYTIVNMMSVVFYKTLGASNAFIGSATSFLALPWTLKFLWSPLVDVRGTKKRWVVASQMVLSFVVLLAALGCFLPDPIYATLVIFLVVAVASATHDIAIDGYYMDVLDKGQQAYYVGIRNAAYKVAWLTGSGFLVYLAGSMTESTALGVKGGWFVSFLVSALLLFVLALFHMKALPEPELQAEGESESNKESLTLKKFGDIFIAYLNQPRIVAVIIYILIFRLGDALMLKMAQPFLLDDVSKGGLAISTTEVGIIYGTVGMLFLLAGNLFGGWLVSRYGLKKCLLPTALIQNSAILLYWWLAHSKPRGEILGFLNLHDRMFEAEILFTTLVNSVEQFSYGLGVAAYTVFLLSTVKKSYKAAHYAIATALMALGLLLPGAVSGFIQESIGYELFFLVSFLASLPGIIVILFLPLTTEDHGI